MTRRTRFAASFSPILLLATTVARAESVSRGHFAVESPVVNARDLPETAPSAPPEKAPEQIPNAPAPNVSAPPPEQNPAPPDASAVPPNANSSAANPNPTLPNVNPALPDAGLSLPEATPGTTPPDAATPPLSSIAGDESGQENPDGEFSLESPGGVIYDAERGLALAKGAVTFRYRDFTVRGDRGVVDYNTNRALLSDNLTVTVQGRTLTGKSLTFDLESGKWTLSQLATTFEPEFFPEGSVLQPIYVTGGKVQGLGDAVTGSDFTFSSCDRGHYYLRSNRIDFYRDQNGQPSKIALRKSALYVYGRKILPLPAFVISLTGARSRRVGLQPQVGQNDVDGYFVKVPYDLRATNRFTDTLLVDLLQKRGVGLGLVREFAGAAGLLSLYAVSGSAQGGRQLDAKITRLFNTVAGIKGNVNFQSSQNNSSTGFGNSNTNVDVALERRTTSAQSQFLIRQSTSSGSGYSTGNTGLTFTHAQQLGNGLSFDSNSIFSTTTSTGSSAARTIENRAQLNFAGKSLDAFARVELFNDLANRTGSSIYQLSRLPEIGFASNTDRLKLPLLSSVLPGNFSLSLGDFSEPRFTGDARDLTTRTRANFDYSARQREVPILQRGPIKSTLRANGRFEQNFYSDSSAKYNYGYNFSLDNKIGAFSAQFNYVRASTRGFTPFQFDFFTPAETFDATLAYQPSEKLRANLSFGRDLQNGISYDAVARLQLQPSKNFYASLGTNYSPTQSRFGDIVGNFHLQRQANYFGGSLDLGLRYSPNGGGLTQANVQTSVSLGRRTQVEALAGYSGFSQQFDQYQFRITRDLHCFNLYATYDNFRKQFRVDLALKAFPFFDTRYGVGPNGQGFTPSIGGVQ